MNENQTEKIFYQRQSDFCKALSHPKRLKILHLLNDSEKSVGELLSIMGSSKANLSQHLAVLRQTGIVSTRKEGVTIFYRIANPKITKACDMVREVLFDHLMEEEKIRQTYERKSPEGQ